MSGGFTHIPIYNTGESLTLAEACDTPLADSAGIRIDGVRTLDDMHDLFIAQGRQLLLGANIEVPSIQHAMRNMRNPHKRETSFMRQDESADIETYVLVPFVGQYNFPDINRAEAQFNAPLRISLGFRKLLPDDKESGAVTTLRVLPDPGSPLNDFKVVKDTHIVKTDTTPDNISKMLWGNNRSTSEIKGFLGRVGLKPAY